jgi:hypothetical protein
VLHWRPSTVLWDAGGIFRLVLTRAELSDNRYRFDYLDLLEATVIAGRNHDRNFDLIHIRNEKATKWMEFKSPAEMLVQ